MGRTNKYIKSTLAHSIFYGGCVCVCVYREVGTQKNKNAMSISIKQTSFKSGRREDVMWNERFAYVVIVVDMGLLV